MQTNTGTPIASVRLNDADRALIAYIQTALGTPLLPPVSVSDAIRAGLRELHGRIERERNRDN